MNLGDDYKGNNHMDSISGSPAQSTNVPAGFSGYSVELEVGTWDWLCIESGYTFDPTQDHSLCFWANPSSMGVRRSPFGQKCYYDNLTSDDGTSHIWIINMCPLGGPDKREFEVLNVYSQNTWVHVCHTYNSSELTRQIVINGTNKYTEIDDVPLNYLTGSFWCISNYGGHWDGYIFKPMWFDRILLDNEINSIYSNPA